MKFLWDAFRNISNFNMVGNHLANFRRLSILFLGGAKTDTTAIKLDAAWYSLLSSLESQHLLQL
jgi:hypothetical protein